MKRFNVDELIWFIILSILIFFMLYLAKTGEILNFLNKEMIKYYYVSIGILLVFIIVQVEKIFTVRSRKVITNKFIPITFVLISITALIFIIPYFKLQDINKGELDAASINSNVIEIKNENYKELYEIEKNPAKYEGKYIEFIGVTNVDTENKDLFITREEIRCCQGDKNRFKVRVNGFEESLKNNCWVKVYGKISYDKSWYIDIIEFEYINEPTEIYFHQ